VTALGELADACAADLRRMGLGDAQADAATLWIASVILQQQTRDTFGDFIRLTGGSQNWSERDKQVVMRVLDLFPAEGEFGIGAGP
jgi:hypothetical protein